MLRQSSLDITKEDALEPTIANNLLSGLLFGPEVHELETMLRCVRSASSYQLTISSYRLTIRSDRLTISSDRLTIILQGDAVEA